MIERNSMPEPEAGPPPRVFFRSVLAVAVSGVLASPAAANPTGPQVAHGSAAFASGRPGELNVTNAPGTVINWQGFSIARDEVTRFIQNNGASAVLNRVTGGVPSDILGRLQSNGRVFLINRNGIVFGEHAVIDTAGFVASTLNISDADFLAGRLAFAGDGAALENHGYIRVRPGGEVMLIAPDVTNTGLIHADDGAVLLAAGRDIVIESLDFEHVRFRVQAPGDRVLNLGRIVTTGGVAALFAGTLRHDGVIEANRVSRDSAGRVRLHAAADATVGGRISATGQGARGGDVAVTGARVELTAAGIDVSGDTGGGRVRIGGDYQGGGDLPRSQTTRLDGATRVHADARVAGDGGEIIAWSDGDTATFATLTARGGPGGGDGGLVETSGRRHLAFGPPADVSAPAGKGGTWLLDPEDITIGTGEAESISTALNSGSSVSVKTSDNGEGEGNISVDAAISKTAGDDASLSMDAHNRIDVNAPITSTSGKLDVSLRAGSKVHVKADVKTNGGSFSQVVTGLALDIESPDDEPPVSEGSNTVAVDDPADDSPLADGAETTPSNEPAPDASNAVVAESTPAASPVDVPDVPDADMPEVAVVEPHQAPAIDAPDTNVSPPAPDSVPEAHAASDEGDAAAAFKADLEVLVDGDIDTDGGDVYIDAGRDGDSGVFGRIDASSDDDAGGDIHILGRNVGLYADAEVDASGRRGGGSVKVGGGRQGKDPDVPNASTVHVGERTAIRADATGNGDGGEIIVYADHTANILGRLSARGGPDGGDGGFVETSGKVNLQVAGVPDTRAPKGRGGTWLIDPINLEVVNGSVSTNVTNAGGYTYYSSATGAQIGTYQILMGLYYGGAVTLVADGTYGDAPGENGDINWHADLDASDLYTYFFTADISGDLSLIADGDINFRGRIHRSDNDLSYGGINNLTFTADADGNGAGGINILAAPNYTEDTEIEIEGNFTATGAHFSAIGGDEAFEDVDISVGGNLSITTDVGDVEFMGGSANFNYVDVRASGSVDIEAAGDFRLVGGTGSNSRAFIYAFEDMTVRGANVHILGGSGDNSDARLQMTDDTSVNPALDSEETATQWVEATDGDVVVRGGGDSSSAGIYAYQAIHVNQLSDPEPVSLGANLYQTVRASGNVIVEGGTDDDSFATIDLEQRSMDTAFYKYNGSNFTESYGIESYISANFSLTLNAVQSVEAEGNVNILGSDASYGDASVRFSQYSTVDVDFPSGDSTLQVTLDGTQQLTAGAEINVIGGDGNYAYAAVQFEQHGVAEINMGAGAGGVEFDFSGGQFADAGGDVNVRSGTATGSHALVDPTVEATIKYTSDTTPGGLVAVVVDTRQRLRAGYNGTGSLNITAIGDDAAVVTGGNYYYASGPYYGYSETIRVRFGTDQTIEADGLSILSETTNGAVAEIALIDGANLDGYGNPAFTQTINIGGDALMRSASGGIARILNDGLNGSVQIDGDFDFHEGVDGASLTEIQLSNLVEPTSEGSLDVLGDTNISGSPSVTGNGGVTLADATGDGTLDAQEVTVTGTLAPGNSPGVLIFPGNLTLTGGSNTLMEIGGTPGSGLFDQVNVGGTATLAGTMTVVLINGFTPNGALVYDLISAGTVSGSFSAFSGPGFSDGQNSTTYFVSSGPAGPAGPPPGPVNPPPGSNPPVNPPVNPPGGPNNPPPTGNEPPPDPFTPVVTLFDPQPEFEDELEERPDIGLCTASNSAWYVPVELASS